jgi:hypothetical protein
MPVDYIWCENDSHDSLMESFDTLYMVGHIQFRHTEDYLKWDFFTQFIQQVAAEQNKASHN